MFRVSVVFFFVLSGLFSSVDAIELNDLNRILSGNSSVKPDDIGGLLKYLNAEKIDPDRVLPLYESGSPQKASFKKPRIVIQYGNVVLGFHGGHEAKDESYRKKLEVMTFNESSKEWEFYAYSLPYDATKPPEKNPAECKSCHSRPQGTAPKPIWDSYFLWPGWYGS